jgi:hypothetical protein
MSSTPDFRDIVPAAFESDPSGARARLRDAMGFERARVRRRWFALRAIASGLVLFIVWSIAPATPTDDELPLIGLAEAVASMPAPDLSAGDAWYVRSDRVERKSFTTDQDGASRQGTVLVHSVHETWVQPDNRAYQRSAVSNIEFPTVADQAGYEALRASEQYTIGRVREEPIELDPSVSDFAWAEGPAAVLEEVSVRFEGAGDVRMGRVGTLKALATLMQYHGSDPAKRRTVLLAIAMIPGIDVDRDRGVVSVAYEYVVGDVAQEVRFGFDESNGQLVIQTVSALATPTSPAVQLMVAQFEARPDFAE